MPRDKPAGPAAHQKSVKLRGYNKARRERVEPADWRGTGVAPYFSKQEPGSTWEWRAGRRSESDMPAAPQGARGGLVTGAESLSCDPKPRRSKRGQGEACLAAGGGPHPFLV